MDVEWNGLRAEVVDHGPQEEKPSFQVKCTCGSGTCLTAKNRRCVCACGGKNHAKAFKERHKLRSLDEFDESESDSDEGDGEELSYIG